MKKLLAIAIISIWGFVAYAQTETFSARSLALGYCGLSEVSAAAAMHNQANLARLGQGINAAIFYQNFWALPGYDLKNLAIAYAFSKNRTIAIDFAQVGIPQFNQQKAGLAYAMQLWENFFAGIQLNFHIINQPDYYGDIYSASAEIALAYRINNELWVFSRIFNPFYGLLNSQNLPVILDLGMDYRFSPKAYLTLQMSKNVKLPLELKWGAEYKIIQSVALRLGGRLQAGIYTFTMGIAYTYKRFGIALGFANHPMLGMSTGATLSFQPQIKF